MRKRFFFILLILTFLAEAVICINNINSIEEIRQDTVIVNACLYSVQNNFGNENAYDNTLAYTVVMLDGQVLYQNQDGISQSVNEAIKNNDTILDVVVDEEMIGKMLIHNTMKERIDSYKNRILQSILVVSFVQVLLILGYFFYLKKKITDPFEKMNEFAIRVAGGNLDVPLNMDKGNVFGNFTEAFDIMRSELKKSRMAEKKANDDKKEIIAKLSHDIKTPVASIKSTSEIGYEITKEERTKEFFARINEKSDQLTSLVDNLFTSSVQEVTEIAVNASRYSSEVLADIIRNADYLNRLENLTMEVRKVEKLEIPACNIFIDKLRLQQVFDNIFTNSYKYANTEMEIKIDVNEEFLVVKIADFGPGVRREELALLKEKYKRGTNAEGKDGAGLGLHLADYFLEKMNGKLELSNEDPGFAATVCIRRA